MEQLFQIDIDEIKYKSISQVAKIPYNGSLDRKGFLRRKKTMPYLAFPALEELAFIRHGFSTRLGGVSKEHLSTLNLSFNRGDESEYVTENYRRICEAIGIREDQLVCSDQVHDTRIYEVTRNDQCIGSAGTKRLDGIDGLITNVEGIALVTSYADCVPLFFVDPVHKAIGLSHSGWRGTVGRIGEKTVEAMKQAYGTNPTDLIAVVGPSICRDCYEVSKDVADAFRGVFDEGQAENLLEEKVDGKFQLDLWLANRYIIEAAGVLPENISVSEICTCCNSTLLYSHRASKGMRGNLAAFLALERTDSY